VFTLHAHLPTHPRHVHHSIHCVLSSLLHFPLKVYDYLVSIGVSPLVELSWMPAAIASKPTEKVWCYNGGHSKPKSVDDWHMVIAALAKHLVARYGADTVRKWSFEV